MLLGNAVRDPKQHVQDYEGSKEMQEGHAKSSQDTRNADEAVQSTDVHERQSPKPDTVPTLDTAKQDTANSRAQQREQVERSFAGAHAVPLEEDSGLPREESSIDAESAPTFVSTSGIVTGTRSQQMRRNTNEDLDMDDLPVRTNKKET